MPETIIIIIITSTGIAATIVIVLLTWSALQLCVPTICLATPRFVNNCVAPFHCYSLALSTHALSTLALSTLHCAPLHCPPSAVHYLCAMHRCPKPHLQCAPCAVLSLHCVCCAFCVLYIALCTHYILPALCVVLRGCSVSRWRTCRSRLQTKWKFRNNSNMRISKYVLSER